MSDYRTRIAIALESGSRFAGLHASGGGRAHRARRAGRRNSVRDRPGRATDACRRSSTSRRRRTGTSARRRPLRRALRRSRAAASARRPRSRSPLAGRCPCTGDDAYQVAVGPIHAGMIESGHFRFHVVGDRILHVDARLFYKHRGLERAAEGQTLATGSPTPAAPAPLARSPTPSPTRKRASRSGPACDRRGRARAHDPARARTALEPPQRHRRRSVPESGSLRAACASPRSPNAPGG